MNSEVFAIYDVTLSKYLAIPKKESGSRCYINHYSDDIYGAKLFPKEGNAKRARTFYKKLKDFRDNEVIIEKFELEFSYVGNVAT